MPSWGTATLIEIVWTVVAVLGVSATAYGTTIAIRDWWQAPPRATRLRRIGLVFVRYETALLLALTVNLVLGVRALLLPPASPVAADWVVWLVGLLFLGSGVYLTVVSIVNRFARRQSDAEARRKA